MSSRSSPLYSVGSGTSLTVRAALLTRFRVWRANRARASRWVGSEQRASSLLLRSQWWMNWEARKRAQSSLTWPGTRKVRDEWRGKRERGTAGTGFFCLVVSCLWGLIGGQGGSACGRGRFWWAGGGGRSLVFFFGI